MRKMSSVMAACAAVVVGASMNASAAVYTFKVLQAIPPGANVSSANAVNANGTTVGGTYNGLASIYTGANLGTRVNLNPTAAAIGGTGTVTSSSVRGISGNLQAGIASGATGIGLSAGVVWNGTSGSATKLNVPAGRGANFVDVNAIHGTTVVGAAWDGSNYTNYQAVVWPGSVDGTGKFVNGTPVNVNPAGFNNSFIRDFDGTTRVGAAYNSGSITTPGFWTANTATSFQSVGAGVSTRFTLGSTATNTTTTSAFVGAVSGNRMVGSAVFVDGSNIRTDSTRAVLWTSITAGATPTSLHPTATAGARLVYDQSDAYDVNGQYVVGRVRRTPGATGTSTQVGPFSGTTQQGLYSAAVWNSTAASFVDLTQFIPLSLFGPGGSGGVAGTFGRLGNAEATAVDEFGNIYGTVNGGFDINTGTLRTYAVMWSIPEPTALGLLAPGLMMLGRRQRNVRA